MPEINFDIARSTMIEQQIRTWEVLDERVLDLLRRVPREDFVPAPYRNLAFVDMAIPLGRGQAMMPPKLEARLVQALAIKATDKVLEVGTGSGYVTALLATLARHVHSVEIDAALSAQATQRLTAHGISNVTLEVGDAARGWDRHAPYDAVLVTGSLPLLPSAFREGLAVGGRLIAIIGAGPAMAVRRFERVTATSFAETTLFETEIAPLVNAPAPSPFVF